MSTTVVSSRDTPPILEFPKHILDFVSLLIELAVELDFLFSIFLRGNAGFDAFLAQSVTKPICVVTAISEQPFCRRENVND